MRRWAFFLVSILIGIAIGLFYGWYVQPITYVNTRMEALDMAYRTDYVLMVSETYTLDANPVAAQQRLSALSDKPILETVYEAILFAESAGYNDQDLQRMRTLQSILEEMAPAGNKPSS